MSLTALRFDVPADEAERWSDALLDAGALSVDAADPRIGTAEESPVWGEQAAGPREWWPVTRLTALCDDVAKASTVLHDAAAAVAGGIPLFEMYRVADRDWVREAQAQFAPIRIRDDFWIVPSWCPPPRRDAINVVLDPGLAFGTGSHPTTWLCLEWLAAQDMRGLSLLDYGCGSGILAIAAARFGAAPVDAVDIDADAVAAARANALANGVQISAGTPDIAKGQYHAVLANILAIPLKMLAPLLCSHVAPGGSLVLAGILERQIDELKTAYAPYARLDVSDAQDGWVLMTAVC